MRGFSSDSRKNSDQRNRIFGQAQQGRKTGPVACAAKFRSLTDDLGPRGDEAEYRWTLSGTNTGPDGTGQRVCVSGFEKWRMDGDGLIAASEGHFDAVEYGRQLRVP
jgi:hypothetical protein